MVRKLKYKNPSHPKYKNTFLNFSFGGNMINHILYGIDGLTLRLNLNLKWF